MTHPEMLGLEQKCVKPGQWLIEGYDVRRVRGGGWKRRSWISWVIEYRGRFVDSVNTLADARDYIRTRVNR